MVVLVIGLFVKKVNITNLVIGKSAVAPSQNPIRNLGSWFDSSLKMDTQITKTCKAGFFYLHNLSRIRRYLDQESTEKLIHALVTSRLRLLQFTFIRTAGLSSAKTATSIERCC